MKRRNHHGNHGLAALAIEIQAGNLAPCQCGRTGWVKLVKHGYGYFRLLCTKCGRTQAARRGVRKACAGWGRDPTREEINGQ